MLKSSISSFCFPPSKLIFNLFKKYFWPKCHLCPILWSLGSLLVAHKFKNKLTAALFLNINEKTLYFLILTLSYWHHYDDNMTLTSLHWHHYNDIITMTSLQGHNDNDIMIMITLGWLWENRDRIYWPLLVLFKTWTMFFYFLGKPKKCNRGFNTCPPPQNQNFSTLMHLLIIPIINIFLQIFHRHEIF